MKLGKDVIIHDDVEIRDKNAIMGLGDGGAHVGFILDAGYPTWLLSYWTNEKKLFSASGKIYNGLLTNNPQY